MSVVAQVTGSARSAMSSLGLARGTVFFVWGTWVLMLLGNLTLVYTYTTNYPFSDELYMLPQPLTLRWLWEQHAEHRVLLAKLVWLGSLKATNYEFRAGNFISVLTIGALAFAMICAARRLRGWTSFSDSFFSLALLNFGQGRNFLWWWVYSHLLSPVLACCLLLVILLKGRALSPGYAVLAGMCLVLLSLSGPGGLLYVLPLALWLGYRAVLSWTSLSECHGKRNCLMIVTLVVIAVLLVGLYFVDYHVEPGTAGGQRIVPVGLKEHLRTSVQVLSVSLGPAVGSHWRLAGMCLLALLLSTVALLMVTWLKEPAERFRTLGLLLFVGATGLLVLIVGRVRAGLGNEYALSGIYLNMALPAVCLAYMAWILYGKPAMSRLVHICLLIMVCFFFSQNLTIGLATGQHLGRQSQAFAQDMRAGVPPFILAERHIEFLNPATDDIEGVAESLRRMQRAGIPQFKHMVSDPDFREIPVRLVSSAKSRMIRGGAGEEEIEDANKGALDFALGEPRFVYAIRLKYTYGAEGPFRISWGHGREDVGQSGITSCKGAAGLNIEPPPQDMWSRRYRGGPERSVTIWVNSTIDGFRVCLEREPFSFGASEITMLVP